MIKIPSSGFILFVVYLNNSVQLSFSMAGGAGQEESAVLLCVCVSELLIMGDVCLTWDMRVSVVYVQTGSEHGMTAAMIDYLLAAGHDVDSGLGNVVRMMILKQKVGIN